MTVETEIRRKTAVSIVAVGMFIALIVGIDVTYSQSGLVSAGEFALVSAIAAFVLVTAGIGVQLSRSS